MDIVVTANQTENLSKSDFIQWVNDKLQVNMTKIEQLGTGSIFCQLLDILYPGKIPLQKVNWKAKFEYEFVHNFKVLQQSFTKLQISKPIPVERLIKCRYQDNLEFLQWFKKFFDSRTVSKDYSAIERRSGADIDFSFFDKNSKKSIDKGQRQPGQKQSAIPHPKISYPPAMSKNSSFSNLSVLKDSESVNNHQQGSKNNLEKSPQFEAIRAERDFFFSKLKDIDHLMEVSQDNEIENLKQKIRDILYMQPEKVCLVLDDGNLQIHNKEDKIILEEELENNHMDQQHQFQQQQQNNLHSNNIMEEEPNLLSGNNTPIKPSHSNINNNLSNQYMSGHNNQQDSALKEIQNNLNDMENNQAQQNLINNNINLLQQQQQQQQQQQMVNNSNNNIINNNISDPNFNKMEQDVAEALKSNLMRNDNDNNENLLSMDDDLLAE